MLAHTGRAEAAPVLWKLLRDPSEPVGMMAVCSLARLHGVVTVPVDFTGLSDSRASVRRFAADVLGFIGQPTAETALLRAGNIQAYSILGGFLIDMHPEQATWVRDFIKAN